ncbi:MAG TPA: T9SS type A sorting domain-containing protein, partial [Puia sp.]|nr:T9SS type A sorting domain-containing protein [Puia sp.]
AGQAATAEIGIYNFSGKLLIAQKADVIKGDNAIPVDMNNYPDGSYILKVDVSGRKQTVIVVKKTT